MNLNYQKLPEELGKIVADVSNFIDISEVGYITKVGDGVAKVHGLDNAQIGEKVILGDQVYGMIINLELDSVGIIIVGDESKVRQGAQVKRCKVPFQTAVGKKLLGRVVDAFGNPVDDKSEIKKSEYRNIEAFAPSIISRQSVYQPMQTGIKVIDALIPIGLGQRELIIGDRQTGKTSIAIDSIINQKRYHDHNSDAKLFCVYVAIGQKSSTIAGIHQKLLDAGAMDYTTIVSVTASDPVAMQFLAPYAGCSIGEYFRDNGQHALVIYDDLSKHAVAYRQISLLLRRPPGREAYPGDIFYLHSRLLERSAKLSENFGGGSLTALPIVETQAGDVSSYIPTNIISITDGQIFLESELFHRGIRPAVNVGLSVSRVGSAAQVYAIKQLSGSMKLDLAQFRELENFVQFSSSLDQSAKNIIEYGLKLTELLKQENYQPISLSEQVIILYLAKNGYLRNIEMSDIQKFIQNLMHNIRTENLEILQSIEIEHKLSELLEEKIMIVINRFIEEVWSTSKVT
ncbi:F0F1 ATP synthase subunit alpha [Rickettsia endosymbiont of Cardiosporidium cionae]|uniref:F0F1 ATP synthase subunit alpha n=1 Tax=Rickettsia endosymbiont of Cardiosporidium cionae TaxID=2777155 RepID=UPI0018939769|nr:F0F1 ATP synthase subunit alpha [Rickettsia endosymbiont of Cardiosporidium cionae]KAF8818466.1 F0F1 ATP synthase subunit alpha [Rickettsia endosymbiont of Cardiosporidium cionae]